MTGRIQEAGKGDAIYRQTQVARYDRYIHTYANTYSLFDKSMYG